MTDHLLHQRAYASRQKETSAQLLSAAPYQITEQIPKVKTDRSWLMSAILLSFFSES
jgi:hypothetical protein